jgi:hypothetical protein
VRLLFSRAELVPKLRTVANDLLRLNPTCFPQLKRIESDAMKVVQNLARGGGNAAVPYGTFLAACSHIKLLKKSTRSAA